MIPILDRINALAKKQRSEGLTLREMKEQQDLRKEYLQIIKGQVFTTISGLTILDAEGTDVTPEKLKKEQKQQKNIH